MDSNWRLVDVSNYTLNPSVRNLIIENTDSFRIYQCVESISTRWRKVGSLVASVKSKRADPVPFRNAASESSIKGLAPLFYPRNLPRTLHLALELCLLLAHQDAAVLYKERRENQAQNR